MASDNLSATLGPWMFHAPFGDTWISESFTRDTDALTRAIQQSFTVQKPEKDYPTAETVISRLDKAATLRPSMPAEGIGSKPPRSVVIPPTGKVCKRKSRAMKRSPTTFIAADPSNFREMVQQVTGGQLGNINLPMLTMVKSEPPQHVVSRLPAGSNVGLPEKFLGSNEELPPVPSHRQCQLGAMVENVNLDDDAYESFPTLESWRFA